MFYNKGPVKFNEFFKIAYDAATVEPYAERFKQLSADADREGMIKLLTSIPCIKSVKIAETYRGKDDVKAAELYGKNRPTVPSENEIMHAEDDRLGIVAETLLMASVTSSLFLDALLDSARYSYDSKAFAKCLKYCECMLALPESFYDKTVEGANHFLERRNACVQLARECSKRLKVSCSRDRKGRKNCNGGRSIAAETTSSLPTLPVVDGKRHAFLKSCSDAVTLQFDEKRGRHLVASRNIKAGCVLIVEPAFAFSTNNDALHRNCLHCHVTLRSRESAKIPCYSCQTVCFCSEKCRRDAWESYHQYECSVLDAFHENDSEQTERNTSHLLLAYRMTIAAAVSSNCVSVDNGNGNGTSDVPPFLNDQLLGQRPAGKESNTLGTSEAYSPRDYRTVLNLETHCAETEAALNLVRAIEAVFLANCFAFVLSKRDVLCTRQTFASLAAATLQHLQAINCNAYEIVENVYDKSAHVWEPRHVGGAIYPTVSLVNHSCYPNIVRHSYPSGVVVVRTIRFIPKGAEILDCYGPHWLSEGRLQRREYLWKKYRFLCSCEACLENWQYPLPDSIGYKCGSCSVNLGTIVQNGDTRNALAARCPGCSRKIDYKKITCQFRKSVERRLNGISRMYDGDYENALPQLLEHIEFIEKFVSAPNVETIKTQQCIIQCYNRFGCTSE